MKSAIRPFHCHRWFWLFAAIAMLAPPLVHGAAPPPPSPAPAPQSPRSPAPWLEWARWADRLHSVADDQGHGPDIGSDEWANALDHQLKIRDAKGAKLEVGSKPWRAAVEKKLVRPGDPEPSDTQRELLASHDTIARFGGLRDHKCMGRTSLCPDRCGDSGKLAQFEILKYVRYDKPGQYGDPKQEQFHVLVEDNHKNPKIPAAMLTAIHALQPGAVVRLAWNHDYVTRAGSKFPERPIQSLTPLTKAQAAEALAPVPEKTDREL